MQFRLARPETLSNAIKICDAIREAGGRGLFVGGCVRDAMLEAVSEEIDIEAYGLEQEQLHSILARNFTTDWIGKSFGVFKILNDRIDVSLPRKERKTAPGHRGFDVQVDHSMDFAEACMRRDFTVNAMLYDPLTEELIDPLGGAKDLKNKTLRHCSDKFSEDALRVYRAMRFSARLDFEVAPETLELCGRIDTAEISEERIHAEWRGTMLTAVRFSRALKFLVATGHVRHYPELAALSGCPQNALYHPEGDVMTHVGLCMDYYCKMRPADTDDALILGWAVLCHDLGKPATTVTDEKGRITSHGHEVEAEPLVKSFMKKVTKQKDHIGQILKLVRWHMEARNIENCRNKLKKVRKLSSLVGRLDLLALLFDIDGNGRGQKEIYYAPGSAILREIGAELDILRQKPDPVFTGKTLIALGHTPGKEFSQILKKMYEHQLNGKFETEAQAIQHFKSQPIQHPKSQPEPKLNP